MIKLSKAQLTKFTNQPSSKLTITHQKKQKSYSFDAFDTMFSKVQLNKKLLLAIVKEYPLFCISRLLDSNPKRNTPQSRFILEILANYPKWHAVLPEHCTSEQIAVLDKLTDFQHTIADAKDSELPNCIINPMWTQTRIEIAPIAIEPIYTTPRFDWERKPRGIYFIEDQDSNYIDDQFSQRCRETDRDHSFTTELTQGWQTLEKVLWLLGVRAEKIATVCRLNKVSAEDLYTVGYVFHPERLLHELPDQLLESYLSIDFDKTIGITRMLDSVWSLLYWKQEAFLPMIHHFLSKKLTRYSMFYIDIVGWHEFAPHVATGLRNRWLHTQALDWLTFYLKEAVHGLIVAGLSVDHVHKKESILALHILAEDEQNKATILKEVAGYDKAVQQAVNELLNTPLLDDIPDKLPALPKNLYLESLPQLILKDSGLAIGSSHLRTVLQIISLSTIEYMTQDLQELAEHVTEQSLATFARALWKFYDEQYRVSKYSWMYKVQGHIGNEETARLLAQRCLQLRADKNRVGAYDALMMLTQIGGDTSVMHIYQFCEQDKYQDIKERANKALQEIADNRQLTLEQLADRSVPDLGLNHYGKLELDFGSRIFTISFDEHLQPRITDQDGKIRKNLPKPAKKDDPSLAEASIQTFKDLKKQLKSVASMQIKRLEQAMIAQRRWSFEDFNRFFVQHPVMRNIAQSLAWAMYKTNDTQDNFVGLCRITEELTFTDEQDDDISIDDIQSYQFCIAHTINTPKENVASFADMLQDYEILQPFEQLARTVYYYSEKDMIKDQYHTEYFAFSRNKFLSMPAIMGLQNNGWQREVGDGGMIDTLTKTIKSNGKTYTANLIFDSGWYVYESLDMRTAYLVVGVYLADGKFADLDILTYSELYRELSLLNWIEHP